MVSRFLIFLLFISTSISIGGNECRKISNILFNDSSEKKKYLEIYEMGKEIIPCLISMIDTNKVSKVGHINPKNSFVPSCILLDNYSGIEAAYFIERIISLDKTKSDNSDSVNKEIYSFQIFNYGVIVKRGNVPNKNYPPLSLSDMKIIKKIYQKWWELNKDKSIEQLRKDWKENKHPLDGSNYKWI